MDNSQTAKISNQIQPKHRLLGATPPPARGLRPPRSRTARSPTRHPPARPFRAALTRSPDACNIRRTGQDRNLLKAQQSSDDHSAAHVSQHDRQTPLEGRTDVIRRRSCSYGSVTGSGLCTAFQNASLNDLAKITPLGNGLHWPRLDADKHDGC